jgi:hypothetical protein
VKGRRPPSQRALTDLTQPQQSRRIVAPRLQLGDLRRATLRQRGHRRVVPGPRFTRRRAVRLTTAEACLDLQQVRHPELQLLTSLTREVIEPGRLTLRSRSRRDRWSGGGDQLTNGGLATFAELIAQQDPAVVDQDLLDGPGDTVQDQPASGHHIERCRRDAHGAAGAAGQIGERSVSGRTRSTLNRRCQSRWTTKARPSAGIVHPATS